MTNIYYVQRNYTHAREFVGNETKKNRNSNI